MVLATQTRQRLGIALASKAAGKDLADNADNVAGIELLDGIDVSLGTGDDALIRWSEADVSNPAMVIAVGDTSQALHLTDKAAVATDWNIDATTHPNFYVHSNTTPATDYLRFGGHDGTIADIDVVGGTTLRLMAAGVAMTTITATAVTLADAQNIVVNATTGTKIGTATSQKLSVYGVTPVVQGAALTTQLTTITHTAPGTPDFAIQDLVANTGFGFVTADEGNTTLQVIANLQARLAEVETRLELFGVIAAN